MIVTCWSVKGGSGTSVVAAGLAVAWAADRPVLAVDLAGDLPSVLGMPAPPGPGVADWLHAGCGVGAGALEALALDVGPRLRVIHRGADGGAGDLMHEVPAGGAVRGIAGERWRDLRDALLSRPDVVVVDAGTGRLPAELATMSHASLLVLRPCFLALRRVSQEAADAPTGVVVIDEPGRALRRRDVEQVVGVRVAAAMRIDPAVARAVDAGLLATRLPSSLIQLARSVDRWAERAVGSPAPAHPTDHTTRGRPAAEGWCAPAAGAEADDWLRAARGTSESAADDGAAAVLTADAGWGALPREPVAGVHAWDGPR